MSSTSSNSGFRRTANVRRNIVFEMTQIVVSQLLPFVVRTILIYRFGVEYLGLNSLFASILNALSLMELGFGTAVVYSLYKPVAEGNIEQICGLLSYYRKIYRVVGLAVLAVGLLIMPFLPYLIHDPTLPGNLNLYFCYLIFLGNAVLSYLLYGYMTVIPIAYQRRDVLSRVEVFAAFLKCALQSALLLLSRNFYLYLLAMPVVTILRNLFVAHVVQKRYPDIRCKGTISTELKHDLKEKVYGLFVHKLTVASRNGIDSICISAFIGLAVTGIYNNYYFIMMAVAGFTGAICQSMMASVGNSIVVESREKNYSDMRQFDFMYMTISGWATVCMVCLFQPFISAWVGEDMMFGLPVMIGICAYFYILRTGDIRWVYHAGVGLWYESRFIMLGEAVANVILNIVLCRFMGVGGIVLATVVSVFVNNVIFSPELLFRLYYKNGKLREYWTDHLGYTVTMVLAAAASWFVCEWLLPASMSGSGKVQVVLCLGGRVIVCSVLSVVVFWLLWHKTERYSNALKWAKRLRKA